MPDYKFGFDHTQWQVNQSVKGYNKNAYGPFESKVMLGYITSHVERNEVDQRYMVFIPELQTTAEASVLVPLGDTNINGIGHKPAMVETGTAVMVQMFQESRQIIIIGTLNLPGLEYSAQVTEERELTATDEAPFWRSPFPISLTELGAESEVKVDPLDFRGKNPIYEEPVQTGNKVPGTVEVNSPKGIKYKFVPAADIRYTPVNIVKAQGKDKTLDEKANEQVQKKVEQTNTELEKVLERSYAFENGEIVAGGVIRQIPGIISSFGGGLGELDNVISTVQQAIDSAVRLVEIGESVLNFFTQNPANIVGQLLDTFGQFDVDLGVIGVDLNVSLTSVDLNLDFRIGTGIPMVDNTINQVLDSAINGVLDNLLKNFNIGEILGLGDFGGLFGNDTVDPKTTYTQNLFTPVLRLAGRSGGGSNRLDLGNVVNVFQPEDDNLDWIRLDTSLDYMKPSIYIESNSINYKDPKERLAKYIVTVASEPSLFQVTDYLDEFYQFQTECSYIALAGIAASNHIDKLKCVFLFGNYTQSNEETSKLIDILFPLVRGARLKQYDWTLTSTYNSLTTLLPNTETIYDPLTLDLEVFKNSLTNQFTKDALEYLESGQIANYINQVIINISRVDVRLEIIKYTRLKELVAGTFPYTTIGFD